VWDAVSIALPTVEATQTSDIIGKHGIDVQIGD
jgi:hypothetical protein